MPIPQQVRSQALDFVLGILGPRPFHDEESILSHVGVGCHLWLLGTCEVADVTKAFSIVISLRVNFRSHPWHLYWTEQPRACSYLAGGQPVCGACRGALITVNASV